VDAHSTALKRADRFAGQPGQLLAARTARAVRTAPGRWLPAIVAVASIGLAACGGTSSPQVARLGNGSGGPATTGNSTASGSTGNPTELLDEWAACMRSHGDPGQAGPTIDASKVIHVTIPLDTPKGALDTPGADSCRSYLTVAGTALRGGPPPAPDPAKELKFSECMRANGLPGFPDPSSNGLSLNGLGELNNPTDQNAAKVCVKKTGVPFPGVGTPPAGSVIVQTQAAVDAGLVPGGNGGPGGNG
jgi:hypothetical protein